MGETSRGRGSVAVLEVFAGLNDVFAAERHLLLWCKELQKDTD